MNPMRRISARLFSKAYLKGDGKPRAARVSAQGLLFRTADRTHACENGGH